MMRRIGRVLGVPVVLAGLVVTAALPGDWGQALGQTIPPMPAAPGMKASAGVQALCGPEALAAWWPSHPDQLARPGCADATYVASEPDAAEDTFAAQPIGDSGSDR